MPPNSEPTVSDIYYKLGGLEGKLDAHHLSFTKELAATTDRLNDHSKRIGVLEKGAAKIAGIMLVVTPIVAAAVSLIAKLLGG